MRRVAHHVGEIVSLGYDENDPLSVSRIKDALDRYAKALTPWAEKAADVMVTEVAARDKAAWKAVAQEMGSVLRREIDGAPIGAVLKQRMAEQVALITSLPTNAAERVHDLAMEALETGVRSDEIAAQILKTGNVTKARATMIARTEVGRTSTELTKARAEFAGSEQFIWRTARDADVRSSHKALDGRVFRWDDPPECDPGYRALPGAIFNCRCYAEPVIPD